MNVENSKTKDQLLEGNEELHKRVAELTQLAVGRKQVERALRESEEKYINLYDLAPDGIVSSNMTGVITSINPAGLTLSGYSKDEIVGKHFSRFGFLRARDIPTYMKIFASLLRGKTPRPFEVEYNHKDGTTRWVEAHARLLKVGGKKIGIQAILRDITERKRAEEKLWQRESELSVIFNNAPVLMVVIDQEWRVQKANRAALEFACRSEGEMQGLRVGEALRCLNALDNPKGCEFGKSCKKCMVRRTVLDTFETGGSYVGVEATIPFDNNGEEQKLSFLVSTIPIEISNEQMVLVCMEDITEQKHAEEELQAALNEKEVLLQEVHHRVKNNMQIISSLLKLQSRYVKDERYLELLKESEKRIDSMALIHEKLYQSEDLGSIDFGAYIGSLAHDLFQFYSVDPEKIVLELDVDDIVLGVDTAIPCGLIVNELVSNCLKYAFPDGMVGAMEVALHMIDENEIELVVSDNGVGMPEDLDLEKAETSGLYLVANLATKQLMGKLELDGADGTEFRFRFKDPKFRKGVMQ